jgi:flotillin
VGISKVTGEVAKVVAQVPAVLESLTGLKIDQLMQRLAPLESTSASGAKPAGLPAPDSTAAESPALPKAKPPGA